MSSNFSNIKIETKDGKIQNVSELCAAIKNTKIEDEDINYLEALRSKLAYDDYRDNEYTNEYQIVDTLEEVLLKHYIDVKKFDLDEVLEVLKVYNPDFNDVHKLYYKDTYYLLYDKKDDIRLLSFVKEEDMLKQIESNISSYVKNNIKLLFDQKNKKVMEIEFLETDDKDLKSYNETFNVDEHIYVGKDMNNNQLYKIKNGLYAKDNNQILTLFTPTLNEYNRISNHTVVDGFDIDDFYILNDKFKNNEYMEQEEIDRLYYEVRYLINTMQRRKKDDELSEALDEYMEDIVKIYENYPEGLSKVDKKNVEDYLKNNKVRVDNKIFKFSKNNKNNYSKAA